MKRVKSFLIGLSSLFVTALIAVSFTPEWGNMIKDFYNWLSQIGVPASVVIVIGLLVAEIWKGILNKIQAKKLEERIATVGSKARDAIIVDRY